MDSLCYFGTNNKILVGDIVAFESGRGEILVICMPDSEAALQYGCSETGGLLISSEEIGLMLVSLEEIDKVSLLKRPPTQRLNL